MLYKLFFFLEYMYLKYSVQAIRTVYKWKELSSVKVH